MSRFEEQASAFHGLCRSPRVGSGGFIARVESGRVRRCSKSRRLGRVTLTRSGPLDMIQPVKNAEIKRVVQRLGEGAWVDGWVDGWVGRWVGWWVGALMGGWVGGWVQGFTKTAVPAVNFRERPSQRIYFYISAIFLFTYIPRGGRDVYGSRSSKTRWCLCGATIRDRGHVESTEQVRLRTARMVPIAAFFCRRYPVQNCARCFGGKLFRIRGGPFRR